MRIDKVSIVIETTDEEYASVKLVTDPVVDSSEGLEDTPAVLLGSTIWEVVQDFLEMHEGEERVLQ